MSELNGSFGNPEGLVGTLGTDKSLNGYLGAVGSLTGELGGSLIPGPKGDKGETGETGPAGPTGERGEKGDKGDKGEKGDTGPQGPRGETGERGPTGETGAQGPQGEIGPAGPKGDTGAKGDTGERGETGPKGDTGEQGPKGDTGPTGPQGLKGDKGDPGDDYILTQQDKEDIAGLVDVPVNDVQVNGSSILNNGVANIPIGGVGILGAVKTGAGITIANTGAINVFKATSSLIKHGINVTDPIVSFNQHESVFYGLAKAAGHDEKDSTLALGTYTPEALVAIRKMLGVYQAPFRTIKEITIAEETQKVHVNSDSNNEPFSLSEVIVFVKAIATGNGAGFFVINHSNVKLTNAELYTKPFASGGAIFYTTERDFIIHMWISGNRFFGESMDITANNSYTRANRQAIRQSMGFCECDAITELFIYSPNDFKFTSGTITIIGR